MLERRNRYFLRSEQTCQLDDTVFLLDDVNRRQNQHILRTMAVGRRPLLDLEAQKAEIALKNNQLRQTLRDSPMNHADRTRYTLLAINC